MIAHAEIIKLIIAYSLAGSFVFTLIVTCLALVNLIKTIDKKTKQKLISVLIVEVAVAAVGSFTNFLNFDPVKTTAKIQEGERTEIAGKLLGDLPPTSDLSRFQSYGPEGKERIFTTMSVVRRIAPAEVSLKADSLISYVNGFSGINNTQADSVAFVRNMSGRLNSIQNALRAR